MKLFRFISYFFIMSFVFSDAAFADNSAKAALTHMVETIHKSNYEIYFININAQGIDTLRYRHVLDNNQVIAQLLQLDGPKREIIQHGNEISYFETGMESFTLINTHIVDILPPVLFANFTKLAEYYDYIPVGMARVSDKLCKVIRIIPKDGLRYGYTIWLDDQTGFLMRADLVDRDGENLAQFRVISVNIDNNLLSSMRQLNSIPTPPILPLATDSSKFTWRVEWLPEGFHEVSNYQNIDGESKVAIQSRLYGDGLFNFSVNITPAKMPSSGQFIRQGQRTIYTSFKRDKEIVVIGDLPSETAKKIAANVVVDD